MSMRVRPIPAAVVLAAPILAITLMTGSAVEAHAAQEGCPSGSFCAYPANDFTGPAQVLPARDTAFEQCLPLANSVETTSFVNHTGRPVTTYQDPDCDEEADFDTHPDGSQTPQSPYVVRAIKIWSH